MDELWTSLPKNNSFYCSSGEFILRLFCKLTFTSSKNTYAYNYARFLVMG